MGFRAYGTAYGFAQSIQQRPDQDLPSSEYEILDTATTDGARASKTVKLNAIAIYDTSMAVRKSTFGGCPAAREICIKGSGFEDRIEAQLKLNFDEKG
eukprot:3536512-Ditylum_brightwellii.AAC.1